MSSDPTTSSSLYFTTAQPTSSPERSSSPEHWEKLKLHYKLRELWALSTIGATRAIILATSFWIFYIHKISIPAIQLLAPNQWLSTAAQILFVFMLFTFPTIAIVNVLTKIAYLFAWNWRRLKNLNEPPKAFEALARNLVPFSTISGTAYGLLTSAIYALMLWPSNEKHLIWQQAILLSAILLAGTLSWPLIEKLLLNETLHALKISHGILEAIDLADINAISDEKAKYITTRWIEQERTMTQAKSPRSSLSPIESTPALRFKETDVHSNSTKQLHYGQFSVILGGLMLLAVAERAVRTALLGENFLPLINWLFPGAILLTAVVWLISRVVVRETAND